MNNTDDARDGMNRKNTKRAQQCVQFSPIISLWRSKNCKSNYLENGYMKHRGNFTTVETYYQPLLLISTEA